MSDRVFAFQAGDDRFFCEVITNEADSPFRIIVAAVEGHDAGRFLAAVLQCMQSECG